MYAYVYGYADEEQVAIPDQTSETSVKRPTELSTVASIRLLFSPAPRTDAEAGHVAVAGQGTAIRGLNFAMCKPKWVPISF